MAVNCPTICGHCLGGNWKQHSQKIFAVVYLLLTAVALSLTIWETVRFSDDSQIYFWFVAGISVQLAIAISLWNIFNHLVYYVKPSFQKYIVRMLGIVPAHSINCWMSIRFKGAAIYLDTIRNFYQALVIYSFMSLLLAYLNESFDDLDKLLASKPKFKPRPPCCCVTAVPNRRLLARCRAGVMNYVIIHPLITIVSIITEITGHYVEGSFVGLWLWFTIIDAISQVWAMYCLMLFYRATKEELKGLRPVSKLITVQLTIFGSFFQAFIVDLIIALVIPTIDPSWEFKSVEEYARFILDFIICIEMSISAVGHLYAFPYTDYKPERGLPQNFCKSCMSCCSLTDMVTDVVVHVKKMSSKKTTLADQIEYDDDYDEPEVELDDVAVVRQAEPSMCDGDQDGAQTNVAIHDQSKVNNNIVAVIDDHGEITHVTNDDNFLDSGQHRVRHDSGSYSASGENGNGGADEERVITNVRDGGAAEQNGLDVDQVDVHHSGENVLGLQNMTTTDGHPHNMEFDA